MSTAASLSVRKTQTKRATTSTAPRLGTQKGQAIQACDKEQLILEYAPTIKYIAQRLAMRLPESVELDDLINAGVIGLMDAIEKYDPSRDNTFKTYAEFRIRGAMLDDLRDLDWVPRSVRQKETALERAYETLEHRLGRPAHDVEVAEFLGLELADLQEWLSQVRGVSLLSLEAPGLRDSDGGSVNLLDVITSATDNDPAQAIQEQHLQAFLAEAIDELSHQEKVVISLYYYEELTMKEIGKVLEITESRVSQIHTKVLLNLRAKMKMLSRD